MYEEVVFKIFKFECPKTQDTSTFLSTFMYKEVAIIFEIVIFPRSANELHKCQENITQIDHDSHIKKMLESPYKNEGV